MQIRHFPGPFGGRPFQPQVRKMKWNLFLNPRISHFSVNAFAPRSFLKRDSARSFLKRDSTRSFLKREDPEVSPKMETTQSQASGSEEPKPTEEKRFDLGNEGFYGGPPQMKRFEMFDGYYEQPWAYPHNKRFDYLDGFYSGPGPAASG